MNNPCLNGFFNFYLNYEKYDNTFTGHGNLSKWLLMTEWSSVLDKWLTLLGHYKLCISLTHHVGAFP